MFKQIFTDIFLIPIYCCLYFIKFFIKESLLRKHVSGTDSTQGALKTLEDGLYFSVEIIIHF